MAIGSSLGITLPTQGGNTGTWGTDLNTELQKVIDAVEAQVPASAIDFSADFDLNGYAITSIEYTSYDQQSSVTALNSLYFDTAGELYCIDGSSNSIQLTASGALNNASAGGLGDSGGTYGTSGITLDWDGSIYNAKDGSGANDYANVRMDELQLRDGSGNDLTIAAPAMFTNYTVTLPNAVAGGATTALQSDASGNCSWSNSFSTDITLSGSAELKHGDRILNIHASAGHFTQDPNGVGRPLMSNTLFDVGMTTANEDWVMAVPLTDGDRIKQVDVLFYKGDTATTTVRLNYVTAAFQTPTGIGTGTSTTAGAVTIQITGLTHTIASGEIVLFRVDAEHGSDRIAGIRVTYDRP